MGLLREPADQSGSVPEPVFLQTVARLEELPVKLPQAHSKPAQASVLPQGFPQASAELSCDLVDATFTAGLLEHDGGFVELPAVTAAAGLAAAAPKGLEAPADNRLVLAEGADDVG